METFVIEGGKAIRGTVRPAGNKNAAIALLAASLLTESSVTLHNVPRVGDVQTILHLMRQIGSHIEEPGDRELRITTAKLSIEELGGALVRDVGSAILLLAPMLVRIGSVSLLRESLSPTTLKRLAIHFNTLQQFGVAIERGERAFTLRAGRLTGADILLEETSVSATEQAICAAVLAEGESVIQNAAAEPHVWDLCMFLNRLGARITGMGSNELRITGVGSLGGGAYTIGPDYVEVASFIAMAALTRGELRIVDARPEDHRMNKLVFNQIGVDWYVEGSDIIVPPEQMLRVNNDLEHIVPKIDCEPWPGFATDLVGVAVVVATQAEGQCLFNEKMYGNRLFFTDRLVDMGANIVLCDPYRVIVKGATPLVGLDPMASPDIRAGMALVVAALCARGRSVIQNVRQLDRGFERIEERLAALGANIYRKYA